MAAVSATFYSDRTRRVLRLSEALVKMSGRHVTGRQEGSAPDISSLDGGARVCTVVRIYLMVAGS